MHLCFEQVDLYHAVRAAEDDIVYLVKSYCDGREREVSAHEVSSIPDELLPSIGEMLGCGAKRDDPYRKSLASPRVIDNLDISSAA